MGLFAATLLFFFVSTINLINAKYLIESRREMKKKVMRPENGLVIKDDFADMMFQVPFLISFEE